MEQELPGSDLVPVVVTVALAFIGYLATYLNNLRLARRRERLELVNAQLNELYGPLYVLTYTGKVAFDALCYKRIRKGERHVDEDAPRTPEDVSEWRVWVECVFVPLNEQMDHLIREKTHLIREAEIPLCLREFIAHSAGYRVVAAKWQLGDFSETTSIFPFPKTLAEYAEQSYRELKTTQLRIIGAKGAPSKPWRPRRRDSDLAAGEVTTSRRMSQEKGEGA